MADSLNNFFDKANSQIQSGFNNLLGISGPPISAKYHSGRYFGPDNESGTARTLLISYDKNPNPDQGQLSPAIPVESEEKYPAGFTPIRYYTKEYETYKGKVVAFHIDPDLQFMAAKSGHSIDVTNKLLLDTEQRYKDNKAYLNKFNDDNLRITERKVGENDSQTDFKFGLQDDTSLSNWPGQFNPNVPRILIGGSDRSSFTGTNESKSWVKSSFHSGGQGTPYENEDPVYFGFEIIIDTLNSPIFNGEAYDFIKQLGLAGHLEIGGRSSILDSFNFEIQKFFKFNDLVDKGGSLTGGPYVNRPVPEGSDPFVNIYKSNLKKRHYVRKIENLDKLSEANTASAAASFVKWKTDLLKLTFYEDVTLSTGTLLNLYKLLYWSRKRGKGLLPENILRFDCEIIVSEIRNIGRVRTSLNQIKDSSTTNQNTLEVIKENVSRYRYNVYECQFHVPVLAHPGAIDQSTPLVSSDTHTIDISFKHSDMSFERFDYSTLLSETGQYITLNNGLLVPDKIETTRDTQRIIFESGDGTKSSIRPLPKEVEFVKLDRTDEKEAENTAATSATTDYQQDNQSASITSATVGDASATGGAVSTTGGAASTTGGSDDPLGDIKKNDKKSKFMDGLKNAGNNLLVSTKTAVTNDAQRRLNDQFRLLNNTIDKVRSAYGIGQITGITNVNDAKPGSQVFFDVRNSLRSFTGDVLGNSLNLL